MCVFKVLQYTIHVYYYWFSLKKTMCIFISNENAYLARVSLIKIYDFVSTCTGNVFLVAQFIISFLITIFMYQQVNYMHTYNTYMYIESHITVGNVLQYRVFRLQYRILKMEDYLLGREVGDFYSGQYYK
jgi:hypothetical protein